MAILGISTNYPRINFIQGSTSKAQRRRNRSKRRRNRSKKRRRNRGRKRRKDRIRQIRRKDTEGSGVITQLAPFSQIHFF